MAPLKGQHSLQQETGIVVRYRPSVVGTGERLGRPPPGRPSVPSSLVFQPNQGPGQGGSKKDVRRRSKDLNSTKNPIWRDRWEARCLLSNSFDRMPANSMKPEARPPHLWGPAMRKTCMCLHHSRGSKPRNVVRFHDPHHHLLSTGEWNVSHSLTKSLVLHHLSPG